MHPIKPMLTLLALLFIITPPLQAKPLIIKFSHVVAKDTPKGKSAEFFKQRIEERSAGRIKVKIYPDATLYGDRAALMALQSNNIQLAAPSFSKFSDYSPQLQLFDLPFLFRDTAHLHSVLDGEVGSKLLQETSIRGLHVLAFWDNGFKQISANRPLIKPEDAKALKFRIMSSRVLEAQFRTLGANPQVLPFSEVYSALQQGVVAGQENTLSNIYTKRFHLVQSDLTISNHGYLGYLLVTNDIFWRKLPDDLKQIFSEVVTETTTFARNIAAQVNDDYLKKIEASGKIRIHHLTPAQRKAWQKKMRSIYPDFYDLIGEELIKKSQDFVRN
jgi:C4-dicarboxylate-binding protein DctP